MTETQKKEHVQIEEIKDELDSFMMYRYYLSVDMAPRVNDENGDLN